MIARKEILMSSAAIVAAAFLLCLAGTAHAATILEQTVDTSVSPNQPHTQVNPFFVLGTGLSATAKGIQLSLVGPSNGDTTGDGGGNSGSIDIYECPSSAYTSCSQNTVKTGLSYHGSVVASYDFGTPFTFDATKYYVIRIVPGWAQTGGSFPGDYYFGAVAGSLATAQNCGNNTDTTGVDTSYCGLTSPYYILYDAGGPGPGDTTTHIQTTTPANAATTTPGSVTVGATGYVNPADFHDGMYLNIALTNQTITFVGGSALDAWNAATGNNGIQIPITASGPFDVSTSTTLAATGTVQAVWSIRTPNFLSGLPLGLGIFFSPDILATLSTTFILGTTTALDIAVQQGGQGVVNYLTTGTTTPLSDFSACSVGSSFSVTGCIVALIIPGPAAFQNDLNQIRSGITTRAPWGYITRMVSIMSASTTAASLPTFTLNLPIGPPDNLGTTSIAFDPGESLSGGAALLDTVTDGSGHNLKDIARPFVQLFVALTVLIIIWHDIMAMGHHKKSTTTLS